MIHNLSSRQQKIIDICKRLGPIVFSNIYAQLGNDVSERTIKRDLAELVKTEVLTTRGGGRSLTYEVRLPGRFFLPIETNSYNEIDPDKRAGVLPDYQFSLWQEWPDTLFNRDERTKLAAHTVSYQTKVAAQSADIRQRELERFVIELSWKSSRIEGNTYTLLDTELLLREGIASKSNTKEETQMILNHKTAFTFVREEFTRGKALTRAHLEKIQSLLLFELLTDIGFRKSAVGITGSRYRPLSNQYQIIEATDLLIETINNRDSVFDKALTALLGISYLQPFVDGNKRTARLVANGLLLAGGAAPLSYRNVDESDYRASLLVFYEQLSVVPMKHIFIEQYAFAVLNYA